MHKQPRVWEESLTILNALDDNYSTLLKFQKKIVDYT